MINEMNRLLIRQYMGFNSFEHVKNANKLFKNYNVFLRYRYTRKFINDNFKPLRN